MPTKNQLVRVSVSIFRYSPQCQRNSEKGLKDYVICFHWMLIMIKESMITCQATVKQFCNKPDKELMKHSYICSYVNTTFLHSWLGFSDDMTLKLPFQAAQLMPIFPFFRSSTAFVIVSEILKTCTPNPDSLCV